MLIKKNLDKLDVKKIVIISWMFCFVVVASATQLIRPFPIHHHYFPLFNTMCSDISKIAVNYSGAKHTTFMSYAWPADENHPLRSWYDAIHDALTLAGIYNTYDKQAFTGQVHKLSERIESASKVIVLLTPDYSMKCREGTTLRDEIRLVFNRSAMRRSMIQLAGSFDSSFPYQDLKGLYTLDDEMLHLMTRSHYRDQKATDCPDIEKFYMVMCNLLNPNKMWGLLNNIKHDHQAECEKIINCFLRQTNLLEKQESAYLDLSNSYFESGVNRAIHSNSTSGNYMHIHVEKGIGQQTITGGHLVQNF